MTSGPIGIIANAASGKDIRRLVAHASVFDNQEKRSIVRRAILGGRAVGISEFVFMPDRHRLVEDALDGLHQDVSLTPVEVPGTQSALDTIRAAAAMRSLPAGVVIVLGGDGTNRAVAKGWLNAPIVSISTGTNNVFPQMVEATVAGVAAGLVASGAVALPDVGRQAKRIRIEIDGEEDDLALIDAVLIDNQYVGSRAVWKPESIRTLVLSRAIPAAVGLSAVGGLIHPIDESEDQGLLVETGEGGRPLLAPLAPGLFKVINIRSSQPLELGTVTVVNGPGVLALDGERERVLHPGQSARLSVVRDGPWVIDIALALRIAACQGIFYDNGVLYGGEYAD